MFARHGLPESLMSDNGPQFISAEFAEYMVQQGIRHHKVTAKWPQAKGEVERQNSSLLKRLQIAHAEQGVRDRDSEQKSKSKSYADSRRGARTSEVLPGDQVLVEQEKRDKLSTRFNPTLYPVVSKHGNSLIVHSQEGAQYSRNTAHVKKLLQHDETPSM